ncbi:hypothetical protein ACEWY4_025988 [Coilia grayii]|uniref:Macrophage-expressed gene 1 protein n=1 Tax=Coilia grayii TaxID=363190 RepID=A0ABD1IXH3_9TELE
MGSSMWSVLALCAFSCCISQPLPPSSNGLQYCSNTTQLPALAVLPGGGWDNLRNLEMGRVMNVSYGHCQSTEDGAFFIPDEMFAAIPPEAGRLATNSEIILSWQDQRSCAAVSINAEVSFSFELNGMFSGDSERVKSRQIRSDSVAARIQVRNHVYTVKARPDFTLDPGFARQAEEIAEALANNQTRQATYLSERLVRIYGTHVITTVEAGALLVHEDYLKKSYVDQVGKSSASALAGDSFFSKYHIPGNSTRKTEERRMYEGNVTDCFVQCHGGDLFFPGMPLQKWHESTHNNLVAIDRDGLPLHFILNEEAFPHLSEPLVRGMAFSVYRAIKRYYEMNVRPGCTEPDSENFNFQANTEDGSCEGLTTEFSFGGVFQLCTSLTPNADVICNSYQQTNPDTGHFSCREPFTSTLLLTDVKEQDYSKQKWQDRNVCERANCVIRARIDTYWCSGSKNTAGFSGYRFGGLYSASATNPFTKSMSCPPEFFPQELLASGVIVCLSNDNKTGNQYSVPFGGFFSCESGNPFAEGFQSCPLQFSQHLAAISDVGCAVYYCVMSKAFTEGELQPVLLPPYTKPSLSGIYDDTVFMPSEESESWAMFNQMNTLDP